MTAKTILRGNATIKLYRPTLTEEEQRNRETKIAIALQQCEEQQEKNENEPQRGNQIFIETDRKSRN